MLVREVEGLGARERRRRGAVGVSGALQCVSPRLALAHDYFSMSRRRAVCRLGNTGFSEQTKSIPVRIGELCTRKGGKIAMSNLFSANFIL